MFSGYSQMKFLLQFTMPWSWTRQHTYLSKTRCPSALGLSKELRTTGAILWIFVHFTHSSYGGLAIVRVQYSGLQGLLHQEKLGVLYVQWPAHILILVLQDIREKEALFRGVLLMISELTNFVTCSPMCLDLFQAFQREDESVNLRIFCPAG